MSRIRYVFVLYDSDDIILYHTQNNLNHTKLTFKFCLHIPIIKFPWSRFTMNDCVDVAIIANHRSRSIILLTVHFEFQSEGPSIFYKTADIFRNKETLTTIRSSKLTESEAWERWREWEDEFDSKMQCGSGKVNWTTAVCNFQSYKTRK